MANNVASKFSDGQNSLGQIKKIEQSSQKLLDSLTASSQSASNIGKIPYYSTGARSYVRIGGKAVGVAQDIKWNVSYQSTPIYTIDSNFPWDIDIGSCSISATLNNFFDPTKGPEADNLLPIMKSSVHMPIVELQVLDASGTSLFFARGMFVSVSGNVAKGSISTISANFTGIAYQHYTSQSFNAYSGAISGKVAAFTEALKGLTSGSSGGIL